MKNFQGMGIRAAMFAAQVLLFSVVGASAATFTVTKTADTADGVCNADCSLREAISAANATPGGDTIIVPPGIYTQMIAPSADENANVNGDLDITAPLHIKGAGQGETIIQAAPAAGMALDRVFHVMAVATFEDLTIRHGNLTAGAGPETITNGGGIFFAAAGTLRNVTVSDNRTSVSSGGIFSTGTNLYLDRVTVENNQANSSAGSIAGGGVYANGTNVFIRKSTIRANEVRTIALGTRAQGGGLYVLNGDLTISQTNVLNNIIEGADTLSLSDGAGVGIFSTNREVTVKIDESTVNGNLIANGYAGGAGISIGNGTAPVENRGGGTFPLLADITNSTINNNRAQSTVAGAIGGGIFAWGVYASPDIYIENAHISNNATQTKLLDAPNSGGGLYLENAIVRIVRSEIAGNDAANGGGIRIDSTIETLDSELHLDSSTVAWNTAVNGAGIAVIANGGNHARLNLKNSTISTNRAKHSGGGIYQQNVNSPVVPSATVINNSTIAHNMADSDAFNPKGEEVGGGIANLAGTVTLRHTLVAENLYGTPPDRKANLRKRFVTPTPEGMVGFDLWGDIVSADYNFIVNPFGATITGEMANNILLTDPQMDIIGDNGGFGRTHRLAATSPAIGQGSFACSDTDGQWTEQDQRGVPREAIEIPCDIGSTQRNGIVWDGGGGDNNFSTSENWEGDAVPEQYEYIIFTSNFNKDITIDGDRQVRGIIYGSGFNGGYTGSMTVDGGEFYVQNVFHMYGGPITMINDGEVSLAPFNDLMRHKGYFDGTLRRSFFINAPILYPVGNSGVYRPVTVAPLVALRPGAQKERGDGFSLAITSREGTLAGTHASNTLTRNWLVDTNVAQADFTVTYDDSDVPTTANENSFIFIRRNDGTNFYHMPDLADTFSNTFALDELDQFGALTLGGALPTSASVQVGGKVTTSSGRAIAYARVVMTDNAGNSRTVQTNSFGEYLFEEVGVGHAYVIAAAAKGMQFEPRLINVNEDITELNFSAK